jgi:ubiquitin carboxyl-terminal hydrolase L3
MSWPALESDPEIFTNYFRNLGLSPAWEFSEIYSMEEEVEGAAVILVYRSTSSSPVFDGTVTAAQFFIKQVPQLDNACGLLAGLHAILNSNADIVPESHLATLRAGITGKSSLESADFLLNNESIRSAHSSYAAEGQSNVTDAPEHHFIALLPGQRLFDGMKDAPLVLAPEQGFALPFFATLNSRIEAGALGADISLMVLRAA